MKWQTAMKLEMQQVSDYKVVSNQSKFCVAKIPKVHKKICVHTTFDVKHDGRHKACVVANGNLTEVPAKSVYSGVVSLHGLRTCLFLLHPGQLKRNAYLEAKTTKKVCIKAGPEFGVPEGHLLIIDRALYGLRLSGKAFNRLLSECLHDLGSVPSRAESSIYVKMS